MIGQAKNKEKGLPDLLNYAHLIDEGVILNKDGAFMVAYRYQGLDIHSSTGDELDNLTATINRMLTFLDDGWMIHVENVRLSSVSYATQGHFLSDVARLIDEERRAVYEKVGNHYENWQFLVFVWKFPRPSLKTREHWFVEGVEKKEGPDLNQYYQSFQDTVERCIGVLSRQSILIKLDSENLLSFINLCITGEWVKVAVPPEGCYLDVALGRQAIFGGYLPRVGNKYVYAISVLGFVNDETIPGLLEALTTYPLVYRWSLRCIILGEQTADAEIKRHERYWSNKVKGLLGTLKESFTGTPSAKVNQNALTMLVQCHAALQLNQTQSTRFSYLTSTIIIMHEDLAILDSAFSSIRTFLEQSGFACMLEKANAKDAWRGSIPGHGSCNARSLMISGITAAHMLPFHSIWSGAEVSSPSSLLPKNSPPVFYASTMGKTPFRFHSDVADVGHTLMLGPTGAGKTTKVGLLISQFFRFEHSQAFIFDKDHSHRALTLALGGEHYDIGKHDEPCFCPLQNLSTESHRMRAAQFIENLVELQNVKLTSEIRLAIYAAIDLLKDAHHENHRNLTVVRSKIQNSIVRDALSYYTIDGQMKYLDATKDSLKSGGYLHTFEMGWLLSQKPEVYLPILLHIFDEIDSRLDAAFGKNPTLILLEEAWLYVSHPVFAKKLRDWLKTLRKKNGRVWFITQSLSDLYDPTTKSLTQVTAALLESCPTRIFLPNVDVDREGRALYEAMGLNDRQIDIITQEAKPKHHYYVSTPEGQRLIDLGLSQELSPIALAFIGLSQSKSQALLACMEEYGDNWLMPWLEQCGIDTDTLPSLSPSKEIVK